MSKLYGALLIISALLTSACPLPSNQGSDDSSLDREKIPLVKIVTTEEIKELLTTNPPFLYEIDGILAMYNEMRFPFSRINLHGYSSLLFTRHSFEIKFSDRYQLEIVRSVNLDSFFLISLDADPGYINQYFAYLMLSALDLFYPYFRLLEVKINDEEQGMYMLVEKTQDAIVRQNPFAEIVIRRGGHHDSYSVKYFESTVPEEIYIREYLDIYSYKNSYSGHELYSILKEKMDITAYMQWLAFNTLVKNGDYSDEVFFFGRPKENHASDAEIYFEISAWDYDELFAEPHRGNGIPGSLVYCNEISLDVTIAEDPYLYVKFKEVFRELLQDIITESYITSVFDMAESELGLYLSRPEIYTIQNNVTDGTDTSWQQFQAFYDERRASLIERRNALLEELLAE